jgi:hypothetical protein
VALLAAVAMLAVAAPAGAMPIDNYRSVPTDLPPVSAPVPPPSSGAGTWEVVAVGALAFGAGAGAARLAPALRLRLGAS